jgi:hypothetical protein
MHNETLLKSLLSLVEVQGVLVKFLTVDEVQAVGFGIKISQIK